MTPTEQDKLREQVHKLFGDHQADDGGYQSCYDGKWIDMTDEVCAVADFITADRKRVALEARIQALDHIIDLQDKQFGRWTQMDIANFFNDVGKYYRELKAQQEEL